MPGTNDDETMMRRALAVARAGERCQGGGPIGCIVVLGGRIVAKAHNAVSADHDPTAHAEIAAIRLACRSLGRDDLRGATLYSTLQPCAMCSMACIWTGIGRIVFGARRQDVHRMYFEGRSPDVDDILAAAYRDDMRAQGGVLRADCVSLYFRPDDDPPKSEQANI